MQMKSYESDTVHTKSYNDGTNAYKEATGVVRMRMEGYRPLKLCGTKSMANA